MMLEEVLHWISEQAKRKRMSLPSKKQRLSAIGPASRPEVLAGCLAGMNVARLNLSHGSFDEHRRPSGTSGPREIPAARSRSCSTCRGRRSGSAISRTSPWNSVKARPSPSRPPRYRAIRPGSPSTSSSSRSWSRRGAPSSSTTGSSSSGSTRSARATSGRRWSSAVPSSRARG